MEKLPLVKYCKPSNFQISANFTNSPLSQLHHPDMHALIHQKDFLPPSFFLSFFLSTHSFLVFYSIVCIIILCFVPFCFWCFSFPCFIDIGNFPALTSLLSIDDLTGSTVIPLIPHEAGEHASTNTAEKYGWQIQLRNTVEKYSTENLKGKKYIAG